MKRTLSVARFPLPEKDKLVAMGDGQWELNNALKGSLPPVDELLAEFDSGKVPRSETWHTLIIALYAYYNSLNDMQALYEQIIEQFGSIQELADTIRQQYDQVELWYGQVDGWQQQVSQDAQLTSQYRNDANQSALTAADSENNASISEVKAAESLAQASLQADLAKQAVEQAKQEAERAKAIVDGFNPADNLPAQPISLCINYLAPLTEPVLFTRMLMPERSVFPAGVPGSSAFCQTPPEQDYFIAFYHQDTLAGKVVFLAGVTVGQFNWASNVVYEANDTFRAESQPEPDATLSGLSIVLHGYRSADNG